MTLLLPSSPMSMRCLHYILPWVWVSDAHYSSSPMLPGLLFRCSLCSCACPFAVKGHLDLRALTSPTHGARTSPSCAASAALVACGRRGREEKAWVGFLWAELYVRLGLFFFFPSSFSFLLCCCYFFLLPLLERPLPSLSGRQCGLALPARRSAQLGLVNLSTSEDSVFRAYIKYIRTMYVMV